MIFSLYNLLGHSPEWCGPWPHITQAHHGGFLILECENSISKSRSKLSITKDNEMDYNEDDDDDDSDDDEITLGQKTRAYAKQVLFFLTESERFQPPVKRPKVLYRTYRLVCIRSTTPEELYSRKIELEEYGDALVLAQTYGLDSDLVYQKQWRKSRVSVASIHDYLSKVKNRLWVLNECVERVPDTLDATKQLLEYGLRGTDAKVIDALGKGEKDIGFIITEQENSDEHQKTLEEKRQEHTREIEDSLDFTNFNLEQRDVCRYRLKLLKYLDRLSTYEAILGGPHIAHEEYSKEFFQGFRETNVVQAAVQYAKDGEWEALDAIFTYHGLHTLPHRLAILSNFSETKPPSDYEALLPEVSESCKDVLHWDQRCWRASDWCEKEECKKMLNWGNEGDNGDFLYEENPQLEVYRVKMTPDLLTLWYKNRALEIERLSKQVSNSLALIKLGKEKHIQGLDILYDDLLIMETLIYECCTDVHLGLEDFQTMTDLEKLRMILAKSSQVHFVKDFKRWALPFLNRMDKRNAGSENRLIHQYLTDIAKFDLTYVLKVFQNSTTELKEPLIVDVEQLMKLSIECIYICKRDDQVDLGFSILDCLPPPDEDILSDQIRELNKQVDKLENHLRACQILDKHRLSKPVHYIVDTEANIDEAKNLMTTLATLTAKRSPPVRENNWKELLKDLLSLQQLVYDCLDSDTCYEIYTKTLLHSGITENILLAGQMLHKSGIAEHHRPPQDQLSGPRIPYRQSVELVLEASREYYNSSNDLSDSAMELARTCLNLFEERPVQIQEEFNLVEALSLLNDFGIQVLPLEVRLCDDKLGLVQKALESSLDAYKKTQKILSLASLLQVSGSEEQTRKGRVLILVAEAALAKSDFTAAYGICQQLMKEGYHSAWRVCRAVGENEDYKDLIARQSLLSFALTHCSPDVIETLINSRSLVETQILYKELSRHNGKEEEEDEEESEAKNKKSLLSQMAGRDWWRDTVMWIRPLHLGSKALNGQCPNDNESNELLIQNFHPFYQTLMRKDKQYQLEAGLPYSQLCAQRKSNSEFYIRHCLLRLQKLSECRAEGSIEEPATEVLLSLADSALKFDTAQGLAYLLALPKLSEANQIFQNYANDYFCLHLATYSFALEIYTTINPDETLDQPPVYSQDPDDVITHVINEVNHIVGCNCPEDLQDVCSCLIKWYNQMTDFAQAQLLHSLGRGVDIGRFARDLEYKKETILGLAMTVEDNVFTTAISLADRYDISQWEVLIGHLEWLFSDSRMATKEIQDRVNRLEMMTCLMKDPVQTSIRMMNNIYPTIDGTMHARLIYYYMLLQQCQEKNAPVQDVLDAQTHVKVLKKLKSAAPGLDYKKLIFGTSPLQVMATVLSSSNVHLLAKLGSKIPTKDGGFISPSEVFRTFTENLFWKGEQKSKENGQDDTIDWVHRYDACHKFFTRLTPTDLVKLVDNMTFSEQAVDTLPLERRVDIVNRSLRFVRQQDAALKKKGVPDGEELRQENCDGMTYEKVALHLEQSARHLESMTDGIIYELINLDEDNNTQYARLYDLTRSSPDLMNTLVSNMITNGVSLESANNLLRLASRQTHQSWRVIHALQDCLTRILNALSDPENTSFKTSCPSKNVMEVFENIIMTVSSHIKNGGSLVTQEDVLSILRPFCANVLVPAKVKTAVLHTLEGYFDFSGEDTFLLLFYQTEAIVTANWKKELLPDDIDSDGKRHDLFMELLKRATSLQELLSVGTLLHIWPVLAATELSEHDPEINPWIQLMQKMIEYGDDGQHFLGLMKNTAISTALEVQCCHYVFDILLSSSRCPDVVALKFGLRTGHKELHHAVIARMTNLTVNEETCDDELLESLVLSNLAPEVAKTPFLKPLFKFVLGNSRSNEKESGVEGVCVKKVAAQLQSAGYSAEAGSLLLSYHRVPVVLRTLDSALGTLSEWLKR
ncbi:neuroblastoma-amplified sequence-like isoform X2 [Actinia tenebrosa]|uniref:Neuroblastoma-amplified sequence-like isoform X2 n=1 Tax=Actinia tenebrosa TaxID=6105 RepID=A0A6P8HRA5_ACTTE|nr:neuroblastoma-amplified sequence-like isoform X2 [Actinia tenebrosa]